MTNVTTLQRVRDTVDFLALRFRAEDEIESPEPPKPRRLLAARHIAAVVLVVGIAGLAAGLRLWGLNHTGFNSDEAVYAGQAASIAGHQETAEYFPIFRAHPLLFQTALSVVYQFGVSDLNGRLLSAVFGLATVGLAYLLGKLLYGRRAGIVAALFLAVMPYHVVVTRQVLLDGPVTFFATLTLYLVARYAQSRERRWIWYAGAAFGLAFLTKEMAIIFLGSFYAFFTLEARRSRVRDLAIAFSIFVAMAAAYPLSIRFAGESRTGHNFLLWQLMRRPNHSWDFYVTTAPRAMGFLVVAAALLGLWWLRRKGSWRENLLLCWIAVPAAFLQVWPTKGFQYLVPLSVPVAVLAARTLVKVPELLAERRRRFPTTTWNPDLSPRQGRPLGILTPALTGLVALSLVWASWSQIQPSSSDRFLAGSGGVPGGREAGTWVRNHVPEGARILAMGPSMANILQFYGRRKAYGLSVSANPLHRNPVYEAVTNPDELIRNNDLQYLVWDSFSAGRSPFFSDRLLRFADRYHGRVVHSQTVTTLVDGRPVEKPVIVIYEVRP